MRVVYQGVKGSYSYIASRYLYGSAELVGLGSFREVFVSLAKEKAAVAVVPIYNTVIGSIFEVYDLVFEHDELVIVGEVDVKIDHNLLGVTSHELRVTSKEKEVKSNRLRQVQEIYSHEKALQQCEKLFEQMLWARRVVWEDTAAAAAYVASINDPGRAAIASLTAANEYGLQVLKRRVQSNGENWTRFVVLADADVAAGPAAPFPPRTPTRGPLLGGPPGRVTPNNLGGSSSFKTSLVFVAAHKPGSLLACLQPFAQGGLNLTKIESRPLVGKPWQYLFYLDCEHGKLNGKLGAVLTSVKPHTQLLRVLGTYPKGVTIEEKLVEGRVVVRELVQ